MARFLALYLGSDANNRPSESPDPATQEKGMAAWGKWAGENEASIIDQGGPLGKTLKVSSSGISRIENSITGYVVIDASSHEEAAAIFKGHPHFAVFSSHNSVEIIECLDMPVA